MNQTAATRDFSEDLVALLRNPYEEVQASAYHMLLTLAPAHPGDVSQLQPALPALLKMLDVYEDIRLRAEAATILALMG